MVSWMPDALSGCSSENCFKRENKMEELWRALGGHSTFMTSPFSTNHMNRVSWHVISYNKQVFAATVTKGFFDPKLVNGPIEYNDHIRTWEFFNNPVSKGVQYAGHVCITPRVPIPRRWSHAEESVLLLPAAALWPCCAASLCRAEPPAPEQAEGVRGSGLEAGRSFLHCSACWRQRHTAMLSSEAPGPATVSWASQAHIENIPISTLISKNTKLSWDSNLVTRDCYPVARVTQSLGIVTRWLGLPG